MCHTCRIGLLAFLLCALAGAEVMAEATRPGESGAKPDAGTEGGAAGAAAGSECKRNADCVIVGDGCCDCGSGGKNKTIPKAQRKEYEAKRRAKCSAQACLAVLSDDPSCYKRPACVGGRCRLVKAPD